MLNFFHNTTLSEDSSFMLFKHLETQIFIENNDFSMAVSRRTKRFRLEFTSFSISLHKQEVKGPFQVFRLV